MARADDIYEGVGDSSSDTDDSRTYIPAIQSPLDPEQFEYYWNDELMTLYHQLKDTC